MRTSHGRLETLCGTKTLTNADAFRLNQRADPRTSRRVSTEDVLLCQMRGCHSFSPSRSVLRCVHLSTFVHDITQSQMGDSCIPWERAAPQMSPLSRVTDGTSTDSLDISCCHKGKYEFVPVCIQTILRNESSKRKTFLVIFCGQVRLSREFIPIGKKQLFSEGQPKANRHVPSTRGTNQLHWTNTVSANLAFKREKPRGFPQSLKSICETRLIIQCVLRTFELKCFASCTSSCAHRTSWSVHMCTCGSASRIPNTTGIGHTDPFLRVFLYSSSTSTILHQIMLVKVNPVFSSE